VSDDSPLGPFAYEGLDPVPEPKSTIAEVSEAVKGTVNRLSGAIEAYILSLWRPEPKRTLDKVDKKYGSRRLYQWMGYVPSQRSN
jgi:hypothetical protein